MIDARPRAALMIDARPRAAPMIRDGRLAGSR